jgi:hypothetical protein
MDRCDKGASTVTIGFRTLKISEIMSEQPQRLVMSE